jgi:hypothetical protein
MAQIETKNQHLTELSKQKMQIESKLNGSVDESQLVGL